MSKQVDEHRTVQNETVLKKNAKLMRATLHSKQEERSVKSALSRNKSIANMATSSKKLLPMNDGLQGFSSKKLSS
jgi:hypothetical protein